MIRLQAIISPSEVALLQEVVKESELEESPEAGEPDRSPKNTVGSEGLRRVHHSVVVTRHAFIHTQTINTVKKRQR